MKKRILSILLITMILLLATGCSHTAEGVEDAQDTPEEQGEVMESALVDGQVTEDSAKEFALNKAGFTEAQVGIVSVHAETVEEVEEYFVQFIYNDVQYTYEINSTDGTLIHKTQLYMEKSE